MVKTNDSYITFQELRNGAYVLSKIDATTFNFDSNATATYGFTLGDRKHNTFSTCLPYFSLKHWADSLFIFATAIEESFVSDTLPNSFLGQSVIMLFAIDTANQSFNIKKHVFVEPHYENGSYSGWRGEYSPAIMRCMDYINKNQIYFARANSNNGFYYPYDNQSGMMVSMFDSNLTLKWTKYIGDTNDLTLNQHPLHVLATKDGGSLVIARKQVRFFSDITLDFPAPEWDIVVYKLTDYGELVSSHTLFREEVKIELFPNPSKKEIFISINKKPSNYSVYSIQGKAYVQDKSFEPQISVENLPAGIYTIHLFDKDSGKTYVKKFIRE